MISEGWSCVKYSCENWGAKIHVSCYIIKQTQHSYRSNIYSNTVIQYILLYEKSKMNLKFMSKLRYKTRYNVKSDFSLNHPHYCDNHDKSASLVDAVDKDSQLCQPLRIEDPALRIWGRDQAMSHETDIRKWSIDNENEVNPLKCWGNTRCSRVKLQYMYLLSTICMQTNIL